MIFDKFYFPPNFLPLQTRRNRSEWATPQRGKDNTGRTTGPEDLIYVYKLTLMRQHITRPPTPIVLVQPPNV